MKDYILKAVNRQPLKFSGEKLGSNSEQPASEISHELAKTNSEWFTRLTLYRTKGGKVILESDRIYSAALEAPAPSGSTKTLELHDSLESYLAAARNNKGDYGRATCVLMNNVIVNHPELEEFWAESID